MRKLAEFFQEANGQFSSTRLFAFMVTFSTIIDWQHAVWVDGGGVWNPNFQTIGMVLGVLGFKFASKFKEPNGVQQ